MQDDIIRYRAQIQNFQSSVKKSVRRKIFSKKIYNGIDEGMRNRNISMSMDFTMGSDRFSHDPSDPVQNGSELGQSDYCYRSNWCNFEVDRLQNAGPATESDRNMFADVMKSPQERDPAVLLREPTVGWARRNKYSSNIKTSKRTRNDLIKSIDNSMVKFRR